MHNRAVGPGRAVSAVTALIVAGVFGTAAAVGTATLSSRPPIFLTVGFLVTGVVAAAALTALLRRRARRHRRLIAAGAVLAVLAQTAALLTPLHDPSPAPPALEVTYWPLPTGRLAYTHVAATGEVKPNPVVVLHGGPGISDLGEATRLFGQLASLGYDVYVYDQIGAGLSARLPNPRGYGPDRDVADLERVRRAIAAPRMILIGHSYGATLAARYLSAHPSRVAALVLSSPGPLDPNDRSGAEATSRLTAGQRLRAYIPALAPRALLAYSLLQVDPDAAHAYLGDAEADRRNDTILAAADPGLHCASGPAQTVPAPSGFYALQYPQSTTAPAPRDVRPQLAGRRVPVLIVKGRCDYLSWSSAVDYRRLLPRSQLVYLTAAGHNTYQDQPAEVLANCRAFLTGEPLPGPVYPALTAPPDYQSR